MLLDQATNDEAYTFWRRQVIARVPDPIEW